MAEARVAVRRSDEDLLGMVVGGDAGAFAELVDRYQQRIRMLCWRITGNIEESKDLTQETFLRVYGHRDSYRADRPFRTWLQRICVNVCLTYKSKQRPPTPAALGAEEDGVAAPRSDDPAVRVSESDAADDVQRLVRMLEEPFRTTLILRVFGGLSYQEISVELGCSIGTVMSRINRARLRMKDHLRDLSC